MIEAIRKEGTRLILEYHSDQTDNSWVYNLLENDKTVSFKRTFYFTKKALISDNKTEDRYEIPVLFKLGNLSGDYYKISKDVLNINFNVFLHHDLTINLKYFCAAKNISIFKKFNKLVKGHLYIGGDRDDAIPEKVFKNLVQNFPNEYELKKYVEARVSAVIKNYVETTKDAETNFMNYMNKKESRIGKGMIKTFRVYELGKYQTLLQKIKEMLKDENSYSESQWQKEILEIILLVHPKYIKVFEKVSIKDAYNDKMRELDFLLVDSSGNVDITEIKKPFDKCILTDSTYRDNHIPLRELSGTVMQIEKYIYYMNKWGKKGEEALTKKYQDKLPEGFTIKIINPKALIIMGRGKALTEAQLDDFEVIKRQYKNIIDIITYDDLISRLEFMINQLQDA